MRADPNRHIPDTRAVQPIIVDIYPPDPGG
jgi:hypothetical protein